MFGDPIFHNYYIFVLRCVVILENTSNMLSIPNYRSYCAYEKVEKTRSNQGNAHRWFLIHCFRYMGLAQV